jgi:DNA primase
MSNVVATLGTALTSDQTRKLKGYAKNVVVLFDPDEAGREAALKSFPLFLKEGISAKVLVLPGSEDPDSFVNKHGQEVFQKLLEEAKPIFDFYLDQALVNVAPGVDGQIQVLHEVLPIFLELEEGATRLLYVQKFAEKSKIDEAIVWKELRQWESSKLKQASSARLKERLSPAHDPRKHGSDLQFLNLLIHYPDTIREFKDQEWELIVFDPLVVSIVRLLMEKYDSEKDLDGIEEALDNPKEKEQIRRIILSRPFFSDDSVSQAVKEFSKKIARIKISQSIKRASAAGDIEMLNRLIRAKQDLEAINTGN